MTTPPWCRENVMVYYYYYYYNGENRAKVIVHYVGDVIVGCENCFQSFELFYVVVPYYSSLIDIRVKAFGIVYTNSCNA